MDRTRFRKREVRFTSVITVAVPDATSVIDMMRYDRCCPMTIVDSAKLARLAERQGSREDRIIQLMRSSAANTGPSGRWRSFCCSVLDERGMGATQLTGEELVELASRPRELRPTAPPRQRQPRWASLVSVRVGSASALLRLMELDCCCPAFETESGKIERIIGDRAEPTDRLVRLTRFAVVDVPPDAAAWRSLDCEVLDERPLDAAGPSEAELAHLASLPADVRGQESRR